MNSITDIANLRFFKDSGTEIYMEKNYTITWQMLPGETLSDVVKEVPSGYIIGDVTVQNGVVSINNLSVGVINTGRFITDSSLETDLAKYEALYGLMFDAEYDNKIKVFIDINNQKFEQTFDISDIFYMGATEETWSEYYEEYKQYSGNNLNGNSEYYLDLGVTKIDVYNSNNSLKQYIQNAVPGIGLYFPFIRYNGTFILEKVSAGFIASDTIIVFEQQGDDFVRPSLNLSSTMNLSMYFEPEKNSEISLITADDSGQLEKIPTASFSLTDSEDSTRPFTFTVGVECQEEGVYQNFIGIYLKDRTSGAVFFMGVITVKTEVEAEDERFRTFMSNFGLPDPKYYSNIFEEQDYQEEGQDWRLINKKSKELFLTYQDIFSYIGTYKALFKAIKFLGYNDLIFKEWYTILDSNDNEKDIAVQVIDTESQTFLKQKLAQYGVSIEDFRRYNKINKLTMIYHLNQLTDEQESVPVFIYNKIIGKWIKEDFYTDIPKTVPIYEYRNVEMLSKIYAVKEWLEKHIIGVNAYISDISGEGIYLNWLNVQTYNVEHGLKDFSIEQFYTPKGKQCASFIDSSTQVSGTLNEFYGAVTFDDYKDIPFDYFIKDTKKIKYIADNIGVDGDITEVISSNTFETPVLGDEYEFEFQLAPKSGTLVEWTGDTADKQQILFKDGEINYLFNNNKGASITNQDNLPYILLENANLHSISGAWRDNIMYTVRESSMPDGTSVYTVKQSDGSTDYTQERSYLQKKTFLLKPGENAYIKYTADNQWHIPLFIIKGYAFDIKDTPATFDNVPSDAEYVLEILKGDMMFRPHDNVRALVVFSTDGLSEGMYLPAFVTGDAHQAEQIVQPIYTYTTERRPFTYLDTGNFNNNEYTYNSQFNSFNIREFYNNFLALVSSVGLSADNMAAADALNFINNKLPEIITAYKTIVDTQGAKKYMYDQFIQTYNDNYQSNLEIGTYVHRLGDYDVYVKAYDRYNNVYVNKSVKPCKVISDNILIDTYVSNYNSNNSLEFYKENRNGVKQTSVDIINIALLSGRENAQFPLNWKIHDFDFNVSDNSIEFDNISFAIDTPKNNDYVIFENLTEYVDNIVFEENKILSIELNSGNPKRVNFLVGGMVQVCLYDTYKMCDYMYSPKCVITGIENNDITVSCVDDKDFKDAFASGNYVAYLMNVTEYNVIYKPENADATNAKTWTAETDEETGNTVLKLKYNAFNIEDVIKIRYYFDDRVDLTTDIFYTIINEVAYRIVDVEVQTNETETIYCYYLNGKIDTVRLQDERVKATVTYANHKMVHYIAQINGNAIEYGYNIGYNDYMIIRDRFMFNTQRLTLDDYIDDTYSGYIYDYDPLNLVNAWVNTTHVLNPDTSELYKYTDFPVTIDKGQLVILHSNDDKNVFKTGFAVTWKNSAYMVDDTANMSDYIHNLEVLNVFRSYGEWLAIKPEFLGSNNFEMTAIDIYGNRIINKGEGKIFVNE